LVVVFYRTPFVNRLIRMVGLGCLLVVSVPKLVVVVSAQAALGAASAIIPPALAALSLGIVRRKLFPTRVSRNESFNHGGNFAAAILAGTVGQRFGYHWIFTWFVSSLRQRFLISGIVGANPCERRELAPSGGRSNVRFGGCVKTRRLIRSRYGLC
jgi:hypothetical protein